MPIGTIARNILRRFLPLWSVAALSLSAQRAVVLIFGLAIR